VRIPVTSQDEIGRLSQDFNQLARAGKMSSCAVPSWPMYARAARTLAAKVNSKRSSGVRHTTPATPSLQSEVETLTSSSTIV
jgi:hypothetical protein